MQRLQSRLAGIPVSASGSVVAADPGVRAYLHDRGQCLYPACCGDVRDRARETDAPNRGRGTAHDHAVERRCAPRRAGRRQPRLHHRVGAGGGRRRCAAPRRIDRTRRSDDSGHGRHDCEGVAHRRRPVHHQSRRRGRGRGGRTPTAPGWRHSHSGSEHRHRRSRRGRRQHRRRRRGGWISGGAAQRRRRAGAGVLRPGRDSADGDRRQPDPGISESGRDGGRRSGA